MNIIFAMLSLAAGVTCLFMASLVLTRDHRSSLNRVYALLCLSVAYWALAEAQYRQTSEFDIANMWWHLSFTWSFTAALMLHFVLLFTKSHVLKNKAIYLLIYTPAAVISFLDLTTDQITGVPVKAAWGWSHNTETIRLPGLAGYFYFLFMGLLASFLVWRFFQREENPRKKKIAGFVLIGIPLPVLTATIMEWLLPLLGLPLPEMTTLAFAIFSATFIGYAILRYGFFMMTPENAAREIISTMSDSLFLIDHAGKIVVTNPAASGLLGYSGYDLVGVSIGKILNDQRLASALITSDGHEPLDISDIETLLVSSSGENVAVSLSCSSIRDAAGDFQGYVCAARDITERELAKSRLIGSEHRYRELFEGSMDMIFIATPDFRLLDINPAGARMLGYESREEIIGAVVSEPAFMEIEERKNFDSAMKSKGFVRDYELTLRKHDGQMLDVLVTATAVSDADDGLTTYRGIMRDVTEKKLLESQLVEAKKMEAVGHLAGGIAHDFNNMLMVMLGNAELELKEMKEDNPARESLNIILDTGLKAAELVQQLLAYSRRQILTPTVVDVAGLIDDLARMLERVIGEDIDLGVKIMPGLENVFADKATLEQVLMNLAINARDAMPNGGILSIEADNVTLDNSQCCRDTDARPGDYVRVSVCDNGVGMDSDKQKHIFEPFYSDKKSGTGLGLSIVYGVIKQHGGFIVVEGKSGEGSCFDIYLPPFIGSVAAKSKGNASEPLERVPTGSETILVAEDEEQVRVLYKICLESLGYIVLLAGDGEEALDIFGRMAEEIDLVILDAVMPRLSGPKAYEEMRKVRPGLPCLFVTGYGEEIASRHLQGESGTQVLRKPVSSRDLGIKVRELLDEQHSRI
ncbi:MAG: PAS domain S-box protein [Thermoleophilia bacterium]